MPKALDGRSSAPRARRPYVPPLSGPSIRVVPAVVVLALAGLARPALAAPATAAGVIVHYKAGTDAAERIDTRQDGDVSFDRRMLLARTEVVQPDPGPPPRQAAQAPAAPPHPPLAAPNPPPPAYPTAPHPLFGSEWGLGNIDASAAWDRTTGSPSVLVAVVDTGVDTTHPDLSPNLWTNPHETINGRDDDGNGLVDDVHGWDFTGAGAGDNAPADQNGHGTHVAGTIGAGGNDGFGVTGVNWTTGLIPVRVLGRDGSGTDADVVDGETYAGLIGARVANLSFGASAPLESERLAIQNNPDTLYAVAAGNAGTNNDTSGDFPCSYDLPNIVCVAASTRTDGLASFSNFGAQTVDLAAPGVDVASTWPASIPPPAGSQVKAGDRRWAFRSGTPVGTPDVAGVPPLVLAAAPSLTTAEVKPAILDGVDKIPALNGKVASGGRLNAAGALAAAGAPVLPDTSIDSGPAGVTSHTAAEVAFSSALGTSFECRLDAADWAACSSPTSLTDLSDGQHTLAVRATDPSGNTDPSPATVTWTVDTAAPETTVVSGPQGPTKLNSAQIGFSSEPGARFECRLDAGAWGACTSPKSVAGLTDGDHTLDVRAIDAAGNADPTPATRAWQVDTAAPDTAIDAGPPATTNQTVAQLAFSTSEQAATFECSLDGGAWAACSPPTSLIGLGNGGHTFVVRAVDAVGNADPTPATRTWTVQTGSAPATTPAGVVATAPPLFSTSPLTPPTLIPAVASSTPAAVAVALKRLTRLAGSVRGRVSASAPGVCLVRVYRGRVLLASGRRTFSAPTEAAIRIQPTAQGRRVLRRAKALRVVVRITFTPAGGAPPVLSERKMTLTRRT